MRNTKRTSQQPPPIPDAPLNDTGHSSTPGPSTIHGHPNRAPQDPSRSAPNNLLQSNHAPSRLAHPQQPAMHTSSPGQSSDTRRPRSRDHSSSTQRNSGSHSQSRPPPDHPRASSVDNGTTTTSQGGSRGSHRSTGSCDSTNSHSSTASSLDRDPFEYDTLEYRSFLEKGLKKG